MGTTFDYFAQLGMQNAERRSAHRQALADEQLEGQIQEVNQNIGNLQSKLSTLAPNSPGYQQTMQALTQQVAARNDLFHPAKNPGALQKFGHLLTSHILPQRSQTPVAPPTVMQTPAMKVGGTTIPAGQAYTVEGPQTPAQMKAQAEANLLAAGAPQDPLVAQRRAAEAQQQQQLENWNAIVGWAQKNGVGAQALDELKQHLVGIPFTKGTPVGKPYQGADGKWYQPMRGQDGAISDDPMPPDYKPPLPASMNQPVRAWTRENGKIVSVLIDRATNKPIPGSENDQFLPPPYLTQKITTGVWHYADADGNLFAVPEVHTSGPVLPSGGGGGSSNSGAPSKGKSSKRSSRSNNGQTGAGAGNSGPGKFIGNKGTPAYAAAKKKYDDAVGLASLFNRESQHPTAEGDTNLVLSLIRSEAGRVNQTEIASMFQAGGIAETPDRWAAKVHGKLPDNLRAQLLQFVNDIASSAKDELDAARPKTPGELKKSVPPPSSDDDIDAIVNALNKGK